MMVALSISLRACALRPGHVRVRSGRLRCNGLGLFRNVTASVTGRRMAAEPVRYLTKSLLGSRFVPDTWAYDTTGNATYESNAGMWGGYGSSGTVTSPIYATSSTGKANKALVNTFDAKNRLSKVAIANANTAQATAATSANTVTYRVNALGQRVQKIGAGTFAQPTTIPFAVTLSNPPTQAQLQALNAQVTAFYANTRFIYDEQGRLLGEYSKDGKLVEETVWFDDLPVAVLKPKGASATSPVSGTGNVATNNQDANNTGTNGNTAPPAAPSAKVNVEVFYVHPDHLGTPRVITASTALAATTGTGITSPQTVNKAVWRWDSDPFGSNATANSAPNENPNTLSQVVGTATLPYLFDFDLAFPGQKRDRETGKHYNYFRDYDPGVGRYVESDPIGLRGGLSTFGYVANKPTLAVDPKGLDLYLCVRGCCGNRANHGYLYDTKTRRCCGDPADIPRQAGRDYIATCDDRNRGPDVDTCWLISRSDTDATNALNCCQERTQNSTYVPFRNDCQNRADECVRAQGFVPPNTPQQRRFMRCNSCYRQ